MSAMKALLALVLCVSQANAAQPATKQACAENKKSVSDKLLFVNFVLKKQNTQKYQQQQQQQQQKEKKN